MEAILQNRSNFYTEENFKSQKNRSNFYTEKNFKSQKNLKDIIDEQLDKALERPFRYITSVPGKNIRVDYCKVLNYWARIPENKLEMIESIIQDVHNGSIMLDDIQDNSTLRRGIPCAHTIFGILHTVNSVDFLLGRTIEKCLMLDHPKAVEIHIELLLMAAIGQGLEMYWRDNCICPTEVEYLKMIMNKTGSMFVGGMKIIKLFSKSTFDFSVLAENIGLYWQIKDDYQNLTSEVYFDSKGYCDDISEGKFGFPIIHAINTHPEEGKMIMDILRQRTDNVDLKKYCVSLIKKCGSFEYTKQKLEHFETTIRQEIERFGENPYSELFLQSIVL